MKRVMIKALISLILISAIASYDFTTAPCTNSEVQQSPINVNFNQTVFSNTNYFRILSNDFKPITPNDKWTYFSNELAIGVQPSRENGDFGSMLFIKDWSIYKFILKKVMFRIGSEHAIENSIFNAEMQLVFNQDSNYYAPGKRIFLDSNYLIISVPFRFNPNQNAISTRLFEFMNLNDYAKNPTQNSIVGMVRNIKLHHFIVNQPAVMYKGTLTYPECQNALWVILTQYHNIKNTDLALLKNAISANIAITEEKPYNTRDLNAVLSDTVIYRNYEDVSALVTSSNLLNYNNADFVKNSALLLVFLFALLF